MSPWVPVVIGGLGLFWLVVGCALAMDRWGNSLSNQVREPVFWGMMAVGVVGALAILIPFGLLGSFLTWLGMQQ